MMALEIPTGMVATMGKKDFPFLARRSLALVFSPSA
jgi:hypothetical protein